MKPSSRKWLLEKTINNNLKFSKKILKNYVWRSSFLTNLQACRLIAGNFTNIWTPWQVFFNSILSPLNLPHVLIQVPPIFSILVGNPGICAHWGDMKFCWEGNFYVVVGIWRGAILISQTFVKLKNNILQKFPQLGLKWNFAWRRIFFIGCWKFEVRGPLIEYNKNFFFSKIL